MEDSIRDFKNFIKSISEKEHFSEMANYHKRDLRIPTNIWIDKGGTYKKGHHYKRIKFQLNTASNIQKENFASISLADCKVINKQKILNQRNCEIGTKEMNEIENFVCNNKVSLNAISDEILSESEFLSIVIKGVAIAPKEVQSQKLVELKAILKDNIESDVYTPEQKEIAESYLVLQMK